MSLAVVILAAGEGKRMRSALPKVLHPVGGIPMLSRVQNTAHALEADEIFIVASDALFDYKKQEENVHWVLQKERKGTGHAVLQAIPLIQSEKTLVLYADVPCVSEKSLKNLIESAKNAVALMTVVLKNPHGYGRVIRDQHQHVKKIVEEKDATEEQRFITEINTGIYVFPTALLKKWLPQLKPHNAQQEYYLTDTIEFAIQEGISVTAIQNDDPIEVQGVNSRAQLAELERALQKKEAEKWMDAGVTLHNPMLVEFRGINHIGEDTTIDVGVVLENVSIGKNCTIGAHSIIKNSTLSDDVEVRPLSVIDGATIGKRAMIGPFARLRPETHLGPHVHIGNFVEIKKSDISEYSKVNHLSYIGDASIGKQVNIGAGTITCNYNGVEKFKTVIEDGARVGADTMLVAPVHVGENATIGAGTILTKNAPANALTLTRSSQVTNTRWQRKEKQS